MLKALGLVACLVAAGVAYRASEPADAMRSASRELARSLSSEQRARAVFRFGDPERWDWHFVPRARRGLAVGELEPKQRELLRTLLRTGLSVEGERAVDGILVLEGVLREIESNAGRDPARYYVSLFGDFDGQGRCGWRLEGHHLSLNFADLDGEQLLAFTPQFFGANPARVKGGEHDGLRVLAAEEDLARKLVTSLDEAQRRSAIVPGAAPADVILAPSRDTLPDAGEGIRLADLSSEQQTLLRELIGVYTQRLSSELAAQERQRFLAQAEQLRFVWIGALEPGKPHYYRIQGPKLAIEYDNVQGGADHVHTLWRDLERDFGDPLREHYERAHK